MGIERTTLSSLLSTIPARLAAKARKTPPAYSVLTALVRGCQDLGSGTVLLCRPVTDNDVVVLDRIAARKSIEQGLILTGAKPRYIWLLVPSRNHYGIIG